jgi:hypothetical protein
MDAIFRQQTNTSCISTDNRERKPTAGGPADPVAPDVELDDDGICHGTGLGSSTRSGPSGVRHGADGDVDASAPLVAVSVHFPIIASLPSDDALALTTSKLPCAVEQEIAATTTTMEIPNSR